MRSATLGLRVSISLGAHTPCLLDVRTYRKSILREALALHSGSQMTDAVGQRVTEDFDISACRVWAAPFDHSEPAYAAELKDLRVRPRDKRDIQHRILRHRYGDRGLQVARFAHRIEKYRSRGFVNDPNQEEREPGQELYPASGRSALLV